MNLAVRFSGRETGFHFRSVPKAIYLVALN